MTKLEKKLMAEIELLKARITALEARPMGITVIPYMPYVEPRVAPYTPQWPTYPIITCGSTLETRSADTQRFFNQ